MKFKTKKKIIRKVSEDMRKAAVTIFGIGMVALFLQPSVTTGLGVVVISFLLWIAGAVALSCYEDMGASDR